MDSFRELGLLGLLVQASPYVHEELREMIADAMESSPLVDKVERRLDRIDFVTVNGSRSFDAVGSVEVPSDNTQV